MPTKQRSSGAQQGNFFWSSAIIPPIYPPTSLEKAIFLPFSLFVFIFPVSRKPPLHDLIQKVQVTELVEQDINAFALV